MTATSADPFLSDFTDADGCYARVAWRLGTAVRSAEHPFRLFTLATVGPDRYPHARTVVLRGFDPVERSVKFYTDCRSTKVRHIAGEPRVALLFYDPRSRLHLRVPANEGCQTPRGRGLQARAHGTRARQGEDLRRRGQALDRHGPQ